MYGGILADFFVLSGEIQISKPCDALSNHPKLNKNLLRIKTYQSSYRFKRRFTSFSSFAQTILIASPASNKNCSS